MTISRSQPSSEREEWMDLIRNEYDPAPDHYRVGDDWDDGAGRIADAILADKLLLLRRISELEARVAILDACCEHVECLSRGEAMYDPRQAQGYRSPDEPVTTRRESK